MSAAMRATVTKRFEQTFGEDGADASEISALATAIEEEVSRHFQGKEYAAKARSLVFNLSKNSGLRARLVDKDLSAAELVSASVSDLATDALKLARQGSIGPCCPEPPCLCTWMPQS